MVKRVFTQSDISEEDFLYGVTIMKRVLVRGDNSEEGLCVATTVKKIFARCENNEEASCAV